MFYWIESVQQYDVGGWVYMTELRKFVDGGFMDRGFIDSVSGIVNRGCHNPVSETILWAKCVFLRNFSTNLILLRNTNALRQPCGTGAVDGTSERYNNFVKVLGVFKLVNSWR